MSSILYNLKFNPWERLYYWNPKVKINPLFKRQLLLENRKRVNDGTEMPISNIFTLNRAEYRNLALGTKDCVA
jgi:hypothetical protein